MTRIYMIRHGKPLSTWGQAGDADPGLDETGRAQAQAVSETLLQMPERPTLVISSPLRRCRETAEPFAAALGVDLEIDPTFGEIPTPASVSHEHREAWLRQAFAGRWSEIQGDLDYEDWRRRIAEGLAQRPGAAVFSHYVAINAAVSVLTGTDAVLSFRPDHTSVTSFELEDGRLALAELGRQAETRVL